MYDWMHLANVAMSTVVQYGTKLHLFIQSVSKWLFDHSMCQLCGFWYEKHMSFYVTWSFAYTDAVTILVSSC
jgi:hypothetical protein